MPSIAEGYLNFDFPADWEVCKLDDTAYYRGHFNGFAGGSKAVDIVAIGPGSDQVWLIEVKDYRHHARTKPTDLFAETAIKVRDSLACLHGLAARVGSPEQAFARSAVKRPVPRIVLHLEQPARSSRLRPQIIDPKTARQKAKQALRALDPHPLVGGRTVLAGRVAWTVA